jgi:hypothetical protein
MPLAIWNSVRDVWETPATEGFFCEHLDVFSGTFPTSGMTVNGAAYVLPTWGWGGAIPGTGSSSLLPTVTTSEATGAGSGPNKTGGDNLRTAVSLLPTPTVQDSANTGRPSQFDRNTPPLNTRVLMLPTPRAQNGTDRNSQIYARLADQPQNLENSLAKLLPTPTVGMMMGGSATRSGPRNGEKLLPGVAKDLALMPTPKASDGEKGGPNQRGSKGDLTMPSVAARLFRTPCAAEAEGGPRDPDRRGSTMRLSDQIREELTGASTSQLSAVGSASLDGQLPGQLTLQDAMADTD